MNVSVLLLGHSEWQTEIAHNLQELGLSGAFPALSGLHTINTQDVTDARRILRWRRGICVIVVEPLEDHLAFATSLLPLLAMPGGMLDRVIVYDTGRGGTEISPAGIEVAYNPDMLGPLLANSLTNAREQLRRGGYEVG